MEKIIIDVDEEFKKSMKDMSIYYENKDGHIVEAFGYEEISKLDDV